MLRLNANSTLDVGSEALSVMTCLRATFRSDSSTATCVANYDCSMLEDPSHQDVARWGKDGDTFVVVEVRMRFSFLLNIVGQAVSL